MPRILVIEDDLLYQKMLCDVLSKHGHEVTTASDGEIALNLFDTEKYDVIICDLIMPNMDGMEFIMKVRLSYPHVNIIAISGGDNKLPANIYLNVTKDIGATRIFQKPIKNQELLSAIEELT